MTNHAEQRCKERGIRREAIILILQYGILKRRPGKAFSCFLTRRSLVRVPRRNLTKRQIQLLDKVLGVVVILDGSGETIITAYHKGSKVKRNN